MKFNRIFLVALAVVAFSACSKNEASFDTTELNRATAKANAEYNAKKFRSEITQYAGWSLETQGDSTQSSSCPQGDGWASAKLVSKENPAVKAGLKCSTVSGTVGCLTDTDFAKKTYASDDGQCQPVTKVPFPIPKIEK